VPVKAPPVHLEVVTAGSNPTRPQELEAAIGRLKPRERVFVENYLETANAAESARRAGWRREIAHQSGYRLLRRRDIRAVLEMALRAAGADTASRLLRAAGVAEAMHSRTLDGSLPIQERALAGKLWGDAENILGAMDKISMRHQAAGHTGPVTPQLAATLAQLNLCALTAESGQEVGEI
jgi:hypothetical protein